ncbi:MAG: DUF1249 domain-containing protein [Pseudomonadota bacterium]
MRSDPTTTSPSDSRIVLPRATRPQTFTALMSLYESNFVRLGFLLGNLDELGGYYQSRVNENLTLHASVQDVQRYTTTFRMTYWFDDGNERVADPDLEVRVYHDARLAEAMSCFSAPRRDVLRPFDLEVGDELQRRWTLNTMLNKWLEYCIDLGHRFERSAPGNE